MLEILVGVVWFFLFLVFILFGIFLVSCARRVPDEYKDLKELLPYQLTLRKEAAWQSRDWDELTRINDYEAMIRKY